MVSGIAAERGVIKEKVRKMEEQAGKENNKEQANKANALGSYGDSLKLIMNALYGVLIEDVEKRKDSKLVDLETEKNPRTKLDKLFSDPFFQSYKPLKLNQDGSCARATFEFGKTNITLDKPVFMGKAILDYSKVLILKFIYKDLIPTFGFENLTFGGTYTDAIHLAIKGKSILDNYEKILELKTPVDLADTKQHVFDL